MRKANGKGKKEKEGRGAGGFFARARLAEPGGERGKEIFAALLWRVMVRDNPVRQLEPLAPLPVRWS